MENLIEDDDKFGFFDLIDVRPKPKEVKDSLLGLFTSEYFTLDMLIQYMYKKRRDKGIVDYLVNKLYSHEDYEIDFYIP